MTSKSDITKAFNTLRKYGYLVKNFNHNKAMPKGSAGFPDMCIAGHGYLIFCEVKIGKDKFSPDQEKWAGAIQEAIYHWGHVQYFIVTENNYTEIVDKILTKDF